MSEHTVKDHCECQERGVLRPEMESWYDDETELPFVKHEPNQCKCTNDLRVYKRRDGSVKTLCSCCNMSSDERVV